MAIDKLKFICTFVGELYSNEYTNCISFEAFTDAVSFVLRQAPPQGPILFHALLFDFISRGLIYTYGDHSGWALTPETWKEISALWRKIDGDPTSYISVAIQI